MKFEMRRRAISPAALRSRRFRMGFAAMARVAGNLFRAVEGVGVDPAKNIMTKHPIRGFENASGAQSSPQTTRALSKTQKTASLKSPPIGGVR
jgi:hypothetical protein